MGTKITEFIAECINFIKKLAMKYLALFCFLLAVSCQTATNDGRTFREIDPAEFDQKRAEAGVVLLDVRTAEEFRSGYLPNALAYDYYETESFEMALNQLNRDGKYLVYCRSGGRSGNAMAMMKAMGFKEVYHLKGGILAWRKAGLEVVNP
jgi:phage shock protein E